MTIYARIFDANIAGHLSVRRESVDDLYEEVTRYAGLWHDYTGDGAAILDDPTVLVFDVDPDTLDDPYPFMIIES